MKRIVALAVFSFAILTFGFASISNIHAQLNWRTHGCRRNPWSMFGHDLQHTGPSQFIEPPIGRDETIYATVKKLYATVCRDEASAI